MTDNGKTKFKLNVNGQKILCWQCGRPQVNDFSPYCTDKCKRRAAIEADDDKGRQGKLKLWAKLITGFKPPKMKEVAAMISGH